MGLKLKVWFYVYVFVGLVMEFHFQILNWYNKPSVAEKTKRNFFITTKLISNKLFKQWMRTTFRSVCPTTLVFYLYYQAEHYHKLIEVYFRSSKKVEITRVIFSNEIIGRLNWIKWKRENIWTGYLLSIHS